MTADQMVDMMAGEMADSKDDSSADLWVFQKAE